MKLREAQPVAPPSRFVECYWYVETNAEETANRPDAILPNGTINLIFNLSGNPHRQFKDEACDEFDELTTRWLSGIQDTRIVVGPTVCTKVVGIRFKPAGLVPFLSVASNELVRLSVDPDQLWGDETRAVHEQLFDAHSVEGQFELLEGWLWRRLDLRPHHEGLFRSLAALQSASGNVSIQDLAKTADLSLRQYRRRFEQAVGLSPKKLARILRFTRLIEHIKPGTKKLDWLGLAFDCGYYDQAHLIADFREFSNVTPTEYLARRPFIPGFLPLEAPMSLFSNTDSGVAGTIATS